ncbi:MAG: ATP-binding cassette domain-containing protein, partial [Negativicutes bacterium]|nr:ATP-binding cassette domain-containing protein [Negativicutes bacterium]
MDYKIQVNKLKLYYSDVLALKKISINVPKNSVLALIGPSGCGKSTFLKTLNRMNDLIDYVKVEGEILLDGENIYHPNIDVVMLRKRVGMVFQRPNPFPMSIYDNIAYGPRIHGTT